MTLESWHSVLQVASIALLILTIGVGAGAIVTGNRIASRQRVQIASADQQINEANMKAAAAAERAARAQADAVAANERATTLDREASRLRERVAAAEREHPDSHAPITPRRLSQSQVAALTGALRAANPHGPVSIQSVMGDAEGLAYATQIDEALKAAGWNTNGVYQRPSAGAANPIGFGIVIKKIAISPAHAAVLLRAFKTAGLLLNVVEAPAVPADVVILLVGNRPK